MKAFPRLILALAAVIGLSAVAPADARDRRKYRSHRTVVRYVDDGDRYRYRRVVRSYPRYRYVNRYTYPRYSYRTYPRYRHYRSYPRYSYYRSYPRYSYYRSYPRYYRSYPYYSRRPGITIAFGGLFGRHRW